MSLPDRPANCQAYQAGGTIYCAKCSLSWDSGDPDAPTCKTEVEILQDRRAIRERAAETIRRRYG